MHTRLIHHGRTVVAALLGAAACCQWSLAAEPSATAGGQVPHVTAPASPRRMLVTQILPAVQGATTAQYIEPVAEVSPMQVIIPVQGAQPGQSTVPSPSSTIQPTPPPQGAQPGQSTIPSPTSTPPGSMPAGTPGAAQGPQVPPGAVGPTFQQPSTVVVPGVRAVPQVILPPQQVIRRPQQVILPPQESVVPQLDTDPMLQPSPLPDVTDDDSPFSDEQDSEQYSEQVERRVRPYGGGHPTDWPWGCNGSPYRTGPGMCDDWRVGCRWHVTVDGIVLERDATNLELLRAGMIANDLEGILGMPTFEQFDFDPGARITFCSQVAQHMDWDVRIVYEGVPEWHASIVYPILPLDPPPLPPPGTPNPPGIPNTPVTPLELGTEQRRFHYTSTLNSAEIDFLRGRNPEFRPIFGVRYIKFDDEINDFYDQEAPPPLPDQLGVNVAAPPELPSATFTDRLNLYDIQNNLLGFQLGLLHDTWRVNRRFAIEGYINGGVYHNRIKYTNLKGTFTTQFFADNVDTNAVNDARTDFSDTVINDVREYAQIAYVGEASLTGVTRLNKCWALRCGYQALYIANVHLADDAYLGNENTNRDLFFHGWHAGIECRR